MLRAAHIIPAIRARILRLPRRELPSQRQLADVVNAKGGADTIYGGRGSDRLNGDKGDDAIYDQAGDDADVAKGGSGNDNINVDDGDGRDEVYCGKGDKDKVKADPGDFVAADCEKDGVSMVQNAQPNPNE